jgi:hypothetical protein
MRLRVMRTYSRRIVLRLLVPGKPAEHASVIIGEQVCNIRRDFLPGERALRERQPVR